MLILWLIVEYPALAFVAGLAALSWRSARRIEALRGSSLAEIDAFSGADFESWVTAVLWDADIPAENIRDRGDFEVDGVATPGGVRVGIQVKRYAKSVRNDAVQQALAGSAYPGCALAAVVS